MKWLWTWDPTRTLFLSAGFLLHVRQYCHTPRYMCRRTDGVLALAFLLRPTAVHALVFEESVAALTAQYVPDFIIRRLSDSNSGTIPWFDFELQIL